jgi:hypothetical protein
MARQFVVSSTVQVKCTAGKGMFAYEKAVLIRGKDGSYESMMDSDLVHIEGDSPEGDEIPAVVDAVVVKVNCESVLVELPRQVIAGGRRIWVPMTEVK